MFKSLFHNSAKLLLGHAIGQGIVFLSGPLLARLYSPEEFGKFALLSSIAGILSILSTGGYEFAIATVKQNKEAKILAHISIFLSLITSIISGIILVVLFLSSEAWRINIAGAGWGLIPIFVLFQGLNNTAGFIMNRDQKYTLLSFTRTTRAAFMVPIQIFWGFKNVSWGLFSGMVIGQTVSTLILIQKAFQKGWFDLKNIDKQKIKLQLKKHLKFPLYLMPQEIINSFSSQIPVFFLSYFFSQASVGLYALPHKFLSAPIFLIGNSLGRIYLRDAALSLTSEKELAETTLKLFRFLFRLGLLPFSLLCVFGDLIFPFVFGDQWLDSGIYAMVLSPWLFFVLIGSSLSNIFTAKGRQKQGFKINVLMLIARALFFILGIVFFKNAIISVALFSFISFLFWVYISFYNLHLAKIRTAPIIFETFSIWLVCLLVLFTLRHIII